MYVLICVLANVRFDLITLAVFSESFLRCFPENVGRFTDVVVFRRPDVVEQLR